ncbi:peptidase C19, ubiquitin C-terminal hydrolase 2 [Scheffersomyces amazonensis]|uniref:peptidase C19, ubiquitin C-terminal hydrolase 2 n=1 Tax=Scheffersomyces amazonensis TaxID=1078765 RepID=UPI00315C533D
MSDDQPLKSSISSSSLPINTSLSSDGIHNNHNHNHNTNVNVNVNLATSSSNNSLLVDGIRSDTESFIENELLEKRNLIEELISNNNTGKEGDLWYLISTKYLNDFINLQVSSFDELKINLGPINCSDIIDSHGNLYPEDDEPVGTYNISPEIFNYLCQWFGIEGDPVIRCLIVNPETGTKEVERYPPIFYVHQLGKKQNQSYFNNRHANNSYSHHNHNHHNNHNNNVIHNNNNNNNNNNNHNSHNSHNNGPYPITISRTKKFSDLLELIRINILRSPKISTINDFRIWFIDCKNDVPQTITISNFINDITSKSVVNPALLNDTLKSQGINSTSYHILIELKDPISKIYPIDNHIKSINFELFDFDKVLSKSGHLGLSNLGNTCYMNSALQCLLHVPEINYYFYYNLYKQELNLDNPLGNHGDIANVFGNLLKQAFDINPTKSSSSSSNTGSGSISPREFKSTIGRYSSMFSGYLQQDSQEFLSWLLDALHEDLNRIQKKPYCEKPELKDEEINDPHAIVKLSDTCWNQHKLRNDSVIVDLFTGLYQSTLVCPDCSKTSITFDPFNDVTLPLPISKKWYHTFTIVDLSEPGLSLPQRIMRLEVELNKTSNFDDLLNYVSKFLSVPSNQLFLYEIFRNSFYADFQLDHQKNKFLPISDIIRDTDEVHIYYIPHDPELDIIIPVYNCVEDPDKSYKMMDSFGIPLFVTLNKEIDTLSFGTIRNKLQHIVGVLSTINITDEYNKIKQTSDGYIDKKYYSRNDFPALIQHPSSNDSKLESEEIIDDDNDNDEGYNSDISLANPYVGADFGFTIKYSKDHSNKPNTNFRNRLNLRSNANNIKASNRFINAPLHKPNFSEFKELSTKLPDLKRNYYHYPTYDSKLDQEMLELAEEVNKDLLAQAKTNISSPNSDSTTTSRTNEEDGFVLVDNSKDHTKQPPPLPPRISVPQQLNSSDEDTESEPALGSLFDSTTTLPLHTPYSESIKPSTANSPIEPESTVASPKNDINLNHPTLVNKDTILLCHWDYEIYQQLFENAEFQTWNNIRTIPNIELEKSKAKFERQRKAKVSLYDCLNTFSTPEILGEHDLWYCPRCKDHKRATKTIQLWSTGDILTIHLKRFHSARAFSDKIDMVVDFPIENLDISPYISNPETGNNIYDLIAVDNHYGGLGGGHYTASVKNFRDDKWYYFNDSRVTRIENPEEIVSSAAYLLFYKRRNTNSQFLGGEKLNQLISSGIEVSKKSLVKKKAGLESVKKQIEEYAVYEEQIKKELELDREIEERKLRDAEKGNNAEDEEFEEDEEDDDDENEDGSAEAEVEAEAEVDESTVTKKSRSFENTKSSSGLTINTGGSFNFDNDEVDYEYDEDIENIRKQRLISKEKNANKLVQIKGNGKEEVASSPISLSEYDDTDNPLNSLD